MQPSQIIGQRNRLIWGIYLCFWFMLLYSKADGIFTWMGSFITLSFMASIVAVIVFYSKNKNQLLVVLFKAFSIFVVLMWLMVLSYGGWKFLVPPASTFVDIFVLSPILTFPILYCIWLCFFNNYIKKLPELERREALIRIKSELESVKGENS